MAASNPRFGDYQCNISLSLAKELKQKPREVATTLLKNLEIDDLCQTPEIAGPGFIMALLLFISVLLHELGHSFMARCQGIEVNSITLFLFILP